MNRGDSPGRTAGWRYRRKQGEEVLLLPVRVEYSRCEAPHVSPDSAQQVWKTDTGFVQSRSRYPALRQFQREAAGIHYNAAYAARPLSLLLTGELENHGFCAAPEIAGSKVDDVTCKATHEEKQ